MRNLAAYARNDGARRQQRDKAALCSSHDDSSKPPRAAGRQGEGDGSPPGHRVQPDTSLRQGPALHAGCEGTARGLRARCEATARPLLGRGKFALCRRSLSAAASQRASRASGQAVQAHCGYMPSFLLGVQKCTHPQRPPLLLASPFFLLLLSHPTSPPASSRCTQQWPAVPDGVCFFLPSVRFRSPPSQSRARAHRPSALQPISPRANRHPACVSQPRAALATLCCGSSRSSARYPSRPLTLPSHDSSDMAYSHLNPVLETTLWLPSC